MRSPAVVGACVTRGNVQVLSPAPAVSGQAPPGLLGFAAAAEALLPRPLGPLPVDLARAVRTPGSSTCSAKPAAVVRIVGKLQPPRGSGRCVSTPCPDCDVR